MEVRFAFPRPVPELAGPVEDVGPEIDTNAGGHLFAIQRPVVGGVLPGLLAGAAWPSGAGLLGRRGCRRPKWLRFSCWLFSLGTEVREVSALRHELRVRSWKVLFYDRRARMPGPGTNAAPVIQSNWIPAVVHAQCPWREPKDDLRSELSGANRLPLSLRRVS